MFMIHSALHLFPPIWIFSSDPLQNYTVRNKGGNIGGYTALFSFVPELDLTVNILWNTAGPSEFDASDDLYPP